MSRPPLPCNIGKRRVITDIDGNEHHFVVLDELTRIQSGYPGKAIYLQRFQWDDGRIELRLGYYIIGKKGRTAGKWVWGQFATMIPAEDFKVIIREAEDRGWI
jgi:hypothetical protein